MLTSGVRCAQNPALVVVGGGVGPAGMQLTARDGGRGTGVLALWAGEARAWGFRAASRFRPCQVRRGPLDCAPLRHTQRLNRPSPAAETEAQRDLMEFRKPPSQTTLRAASTRRQGPCAGDPAATRGRGARCYSGGLRCVRGPCGFRPHGSKVCVTASSQPPLEGLALTLLSLLPPPDCPAPRPRLLSLGGREPATL